MHSPRTAPTATLTGRCVLLAVVALVLALRDPRLLTASRFWGEEGAIYFADAYSKPLANAFFGCVQGYYSLIHQLAAHLATLVPLEHAPLVTTLVALAVQMVPPLLVARLVHRLGMPTTARWAALAAALIAQPVHETWLTTTGSQYYLTLAAGLYVLFAEDLALPRLGILLAAIAGLSSPQTAAILPCGLYLAWRRPDRARRLAVLVLVLCVALQAIIHLSTTAAWQPRAGLPPSIALGTLFVKCYALPLVGPDGSFWCGLWLQFQIQQGTFWSWAPLLLLPIVGLWRLCWPSVPARWTLLLGHSLLLMAVAGSLGDKLALVTGLAQGRYALAANVLHLLALLLALHDGLPRWPRRIALLLLGTCLVHGVYEYAILRDPCRSGPDWRTEVQLFQADPKYALRIWPEPWRMTLQPR